MFQFASTAKPVGCGLGTQSLAMSQQFGNP